MRFTIRVLLALLAGLLAGFLISHLPPGPWARIPAFLEPIGTIYINAIRVCVIPMVMASLIAGVASAGAGQIRSLGVRALAVILVALVAAVLFSGALSLVLFSNLKTDSGLAAAYNDHVPAGPSPSLVKWFIDLVPPNIMSALADGSLLPLIVFSIAFGLALTAVEEQRRDRVVEFFKGIADAFIVLINFVVLLAPIGVFALAVPLAARTGIGAVGTLAYYVLCMSAIHVAFLVVAAYPAVAIFGRVSLSRFSRAASPSQAVAFTSRSSMASLPVVYTAAQTLGLSEPICNFLLPLLASLFRVGGAMQQVAGVIFLAKVTGVPLGGFQLATLALSSVATSLTIPGVPGGSVLVMAPVLSSVGVPVAGMALLLAVDAIPDMFRTVANVTGWLAAGVILARDRERPQA